MTAGMSNLISRSGWRHREGSLHVRARREDITPAPAAVSSRRARQSPRKPPQSPIDGRQPAQDRQKTATARTEPQGGPPAPHNAPGRARQKAPAPCQRPSEAQESISDRNWKKYQSKAINGHHGPHRSTGEEIRPAQTSDRRTEHPPEGPRSLPAPQETQDAPRTAEEPAGGPEEPPRAPQRAVIACPRSKR